MRKSYLCRFPVGVVFGLFSYLALASDVVSSKEHSTIVVNSQEKTGITESARDWSLSDIEWVRYLQLMKGQNGRWYPQLTPPQVLGLNADNVEERRHFAEISARIEHEKVEKELAFNHEFYTAMRRLYPDEPLIVEFDKTPFNPKQSMK